MSQENLSITAIDMNQTTIKQQIMNKADNFFDLRYAT